MKAISIWQPWASLIAHGIKHYETRGWAPPHGVVGTRIAICAAKTRAGFEFCRPDLAAPAGTLGRIVDDRLGRLELLPLGAVIATAVVHEAILCPALESEEPGPAERAMGDWSDGRWAWRLGDVRRLEPALPVIGRQRLFNLRPKLAREIEQSAYWKATQIPIGLP